MINTEKSTNHMDSNLPTLQFPKIPLRKHILSPMEHSPEEWDKTSKKMWPKTPYGYAAGFTIKNRPIINKNILNKRKISIMAHETMHALFNAIEAEYGAEAKQNLIKILLDQVHPIARHYLVEALCKMGYRDRSPELLQEELLLYLHTYQTDPINQKRIDRCLQSKTKQQFLRKHAEKSWINILQRAANISPADLQPQKLAKKIADKDIHFLIDNAHSSHNESIVDPSFHLENYPVEEAFKEYILNHPDNTKLRDFYDTGTSYKLFYGHQHNKYMIKPYHQKPGHIDFKLNTLEPILGGWATLTNAGLYKAAGIEHLNENVGVFKHQNKHFVVHKLEKDFNSDHLDTDAIYNADPHDIVKIGVMDYLTHNQDRHKQNLIYHQAFMQLKAIDHEKSFQYHSQHWPHQTLESFLTTSGLQNMYQYNLENNKIDFTKIADWWLDVSHDVSQEFNKHLMAIKDEHLRDHLAKNFHHRINKLNKWSKGILSGEKHTILDDHTRPKIFHKKVNESKMQKIFNILHAGVSDPLNSVYTILDAVNTTPKLSDFDMQTVKAALNHLYTLMRPEHAVHVYNSATTNPKYLKENIKKLHIPRNMINAFNQLKLSGHRKALLQHIDSLPQEQQDLHRFAKKQLSRPL